MEDCCSGRASGDYAPKNPDFNPPLWKSPLFSVSTCLRGETFLSYVCALRGRNITSDNRYYVNYHVNQAWRASNLRLIPLAEAVSGPL